MNNTVKMWLATARPKTLPLALASIFSGSALAAWQHKFQPSIMFLCLLTTTLLQILSNFANDYGDHQKGSDTAQRIGPLRGIQQGMISAKQLKNALILLVIASIASGAGLLILAYESVSDLLIFALLGILAIVAAITYTVGTKPYGYLGLGDVSVLLFFGLLGVGGSYYLQTHQFDWSILLPAFASGLLAVAVLNINNLRDIEQDKSAGKNTLVVRIGAKNGRRYHSMLLLCALVCYFFFAFFIVKQGFAFLVLLSTPFLIRHARFVYSNLEPIALRPMLAQMALLALLCNLLFSIGLILVV